MQTMNLNEPQLDTGSQDVSIYGFQLVNMGGTITFAYQ